MEPIEPPWQAVKEWIPDDEPDLDWFNRPRNPTNPDPDGFDQRPSSDCSDFSYSGPLTETILLGSLAIRTGNGFAWDAAKMEITGNPAAAALIKIEARKGWRPEDLA